MPQGSILGPLLFNIFLADLILVMKDVDIAYFADNNTPFTSANSIDDLIDSLEKASSSLFKWFKDNLFKGDPDLLVSTNEETKINIGEFSIENSDCEKLLVVKIDNKLTFDCHVSDMCKKANRKINALARIAPFINMQVLAIEMFKVSNGLSPVLMNDIFNLRGEQTDNLTKLSQFYRPKVNSLYNGTERVSFLGPIIWDLVPNELKYIGNQAAFKKAIKKWSSEKCPCRLCKVYISNVGSI